MPAHCPHCQVVLSGHERHREACPVCGQKLLGAARAPQLTPSEKARLIDALTQTRSEQWAQSLRIIAGMSFASCFALIFRHAHTPEDVLLALIIAGGIAGSYLILSILAAKLPTSG